MNTPNDDGKTIMDLNDDCLIEIFQYLTIPDTFSLIGCFDERIDNVAFKRIAQVKHFKFSLRDPPLYTNWQLDVIGRNLKSLYICAGYASPSQLVLDCLQPICQDQGSLKILVLDFVKFDNLYQKCILNVAANLEILSLSYCKLTDVLLQPILEKCTNLKHLSVHGNHILKCESLKFLNSKYLKELEVEQNDYSKDAIQAFIVENPHVIVTVFPEGYLSFKAYCTTK